MKQTAVEWLINQLFNESTVIVTNENNPSLFEVLEKAKEMERQQIMKAYETGRCRGMSFDEPIYYDRNWSSNEQYYNETFKSE